MDPEQHEERYSLEAKAVAALRSPVRRAQHRSECHAFVLPSFDDCRAYTVLAGRRGGERASVAVRRTWRRGADFEKLSSPLVRLRYPASLEPTVNVQEVPIDVEVADSLLSRAAALALPAWTPDGRVGLDGVRFGLVLGGGLLSATFEWWHEPPAVWAGLGALHGELISAVDRLCPLDEPG